MNSSYRIKYNQENSTDHLKIKIDKSFDFLEVLTLKISQEDVYKTYTSDYGVLVGRVVANDGFGIPNAKISIFIKNKNSNYLDDKNIIYPYSTTSSLNNSNVRYNLLPSQKINKCHQNVGTFPSKRELLDNDVYTDVFDEFYKYTTTSNESGDYMIFGLPVGDQQIHVDIDLSDIGVLSQTPRDMTYKGYNLKQFDSPNKFKKSTNLDSLTQLITENTTVFIYPFWGDKSENEIAISKKDINIKYKFEPTCVFMGSIFTDSTKSYISKTCRPNKNSGKLNELTTNQGSIQMIRYNLNDEIETLSLNGDRLIDNNGVWCYQIPMNLDYVITDEYGNIVPSSDPNKGIPTRTKMRFKIDIDDNGDSFIQNKTGSYLVPNNPKNISDEDYQFNSSCKPNSFVDLLWNKVYTVKNYIPRIQKTTNTKTRNFNGLKSVNYHESNNPAPYNNIWVDLNLRFMLLCLISKFVITTVGRVNTIISIIGNGIFSVVVKKMQYIAINTSVFGDDCSFLSEYDYFVPHNANSIEFEGQADYFEDVITNTQTGNTGNIYFERRNMATDASQMALDCIENQLSSDSSVVNFDFTNDWLNGSLYAPKFLIKNKKNRKTGKLSGKYCGSYNINNYDFLNIVQTCAVDINKNGDFPNGVNSNTECYKNEKCYELGSSKPIGRGIIKRNNTEDSFYYRAVEFPEDSNASTQIKYFQPTGIVLIGSLNECDVDGIPQLHQLLPQTSFKLPPDYPEFDTITEIYTGYTYQYNYIVSYYYELPEVGDQGLYYVSAINKYYTWDVDNERYKLMTETDLSGVYPQVPYTGTTTHNNVTQISGIDWGNNQTKRKDGLYVSVGCFNSKTITKTCVNASRLCEIGVDFDDLVESEDGILGKVSDGYISIDEITDGDVRAMFATLNINNLSVKTDDNNQLKYDFAYNFPNSFDGRLKTTGYSGNTISTATGLTSDYNSDTQARNDYYKFRFGLKNDSSLGYFYYDINPNNYSFPRYENSFYFYFGLKPGLTALDSFNTQYFVPCT